MRANNAASTASILFLLCASIIIQTSGASSNALLLGQRLPTAFCSLSNNSSTSRKSRHPATISIQTLQATENSEADQLTNDSTASENTKEMGGTWNPFSLAVLKLGFTEPAWTSPLNYKNSNGRYLCANCNSPLFSSSAKYDSGSGWPSFWKTIASNQVSMEREWDGRIECKCANCGGHLGHIFPDGPTRGSLEVKELETVPETDPQIGYKAQGDDAGGKDSKYSRMPRFCVNGIAMRFEEENQ